MERILRSIEKSLDNENWYSALISSLVLPDICGKLEGSGKSTSERYPEWFDCYLGNQYDGFLSGKDCYALRCAFLHEGSDNIDKQRAKNVLDYFIFLSRGSHCNKISKCILGSTKYERKEVLQLSVYNFCQDMIGAARRWIEDESINKNFTELLEIHEDSFGF